MRFLFVIVVCVFLSACGGLSVQQHDLSDYPAMPADARPAPIGFSKLRYHIPTGSSVASRSPKGVFGIFTCGLPYNTIQRGMITRAIVDDNMRQIFNTTLESQGYDVTGDPGRLFDEMEDMQRTIYAIGARITQMRLDVCEREDFLLGYERGIEGEGEMTVEWTIFDKLHRRNAYQVTTQGYARLDVPNIEGLSLITEEAFAAAAHNLGADTGFRDLVVYGRLPEKMPGTYTDPEEEPLAGEEDIKPLTLQNPALYSNPATTRMEALRENAVMIESGVGHGSGFFIDKGQTIITNAHVVGHADRVRVVTSGKKKKTIARVLRRDTKRDVALLQLEKPAALNLTPYPIRLEKPQVGEEIYAIGTPRLTRLQDTVTKGIVSALRYDRREKQDYIQGDVTLHGGNSGGPLLDASGNLIGIAVSAYSESGSENTGLNNFIPIQSALQALQISLE